MVLRITRFKKSTWGLTHDNAINQIKYTIINMGAQHKSFLYSIWEFTDTLSPYDQVEFERCFITLQDRCVHNLYANSKSIQ